MTAHDDLIAELLAELRAAAVAPAPAPEPELPAEPITLRPRRIKGKASWLVDLPVQTRPDGTKVTGTAWHGPTECPDCGRGLVSRGHDLVCARVPITVRVPGTGGIVRCGVTDG